MKTKDSLRRGKKGGEGRKTKAGGRRWTAVTEEGRTGPICTHKLPPATFSELLHKSWQGPSIPSDLVIQGLNWPHWSFQQVAAEQTGFSFYYNKKKRNPRSFNYFLLWKTESFSFLKTWSLLCVLHSNHLQASACFWHECGRWNTTIQRTGAQLWRSDHWWGKSLKVCSGQR